MNRFFYILYFLDTSHVEFGKCRSKTGLILVLDRSGSIRPSDYNEMREFLKILAHSLQIGVRNEQGEVIGQGGLVTFSEAGTTRITLQESRGPGLFEEVVDRMPGPQRGGRTKTHLGLDVADKYIATKEAGFREDEKDAKKILMAITDGKQTRGGRGYVRRETVDA